jgi:hypothetical protein
VFQESVRAVDEQVDQVQRLEAELLERAPAWRLYPVVQALQALRGVNSSSRSPSWPNSATSAL